MTILGVDPGVNGAFALIEDGVPVLVMDLPTVAVIKNDRKRRELDDYEFARMIDSAGHIDHAFIERVGARGGKPTKPGDDPSKPEKRDGAVQAFAFGAVFGGIKAVIAAHFIPRTLVSPIEWRNALGIRRAEKPGDKSLVVARANELFPLHAHLWVAKCHADRAEAALIAEYGRRVLGAA